MIQGFFSRGFKHIVISNLFDALTTYVLVFDIGASEVNPVISSLVLPYGLPGLILFKIIIVLTLIFLLYLSFESRFANSSSRIHKILDRHYSIETNYGNVLLPCALIIYVVVVLNSLQLIVAGFL